MLSYLVGCDPTAAQWDELSALMMKKKHVVVFDSAYQVHNASISLTNRGNIKLTTICLLNYIHIAHVFMHI
jgi:aspartate/tyrosine/aromatic aminotransferase